LKLSETST